MSEMRGGQKTTKMSEIQIETFETPLGVSISKFKLYKKNRLLYITTIAPFRRSQ